MKFSQLGYTRTKNPESGDCQINNEIGLSKHLNHMINQTNFYSANNASESRGPRWQKLVTAFTARNVNYKWTNGNPAENDKYGSLET